jgi:hypothetical protein
MRQLAPLLAVLVPAVALANGGPVAWTQPSGAGDIVPVSETKVALVSERLTIRFEDDGARYRVHAEYVLANPGPEASLKYGVPLFWYPPDMGEFDGPVEPAKRPLVDKEGLAYPNDVRIAIGDRRFSCTLENIRRGRSDTEGENIEGWCVTRIEIPASSRITLTLDYAGSFRFVDWLYTKSPFTRHGLRSLQYDISPAGHWAGTPKQLDVTIEPGIWKEFFRPRAPEGFTDDGSRFILHLLDADLNKVGRIEGTLDAGKVLAHRERATIKPDPRFKATASSELASQAGDTYSAAKLLDGNPSTAWCASRARPAIGQWVEARAAQIEVPGYCGLHGYVLVPGYAKNQQTWSRNNRIRSVRVATCGDPSSGAVVPIEVSDRFDTSAVEIERLADDAFNAALWKQRADPDVASEKLKARVKNYCIRLTIEAVVEGQASDTCISEFRPVINCQ